MLGSQQGSWKGPGPGGSALQHGVPSSWGWERSQEPSGGEAGLSGPTLAAAMGTARGRAGPGAHHWPCLPPAVAVAWCGLERERHLRAAGARPPLLQALHLQAHARGVRPAGGAAVGGAAACWGRAPRSNRVCAEAPSPMGLELSPAQILSRRPTGSCLGASVVATLGALLAPREWGAGVRPHRPESQPCWDGETLLWGLVGIQYLGGTACSPGSCFLSFTADPLLPPRQVQPSLLCFWRGQVQLPGHEAVAGGQPGPHG